jgi:tyrosine-protein phosphatase YwqE
MANETIVNYDTHANVKNEAMLILKQANQNGVRLGATVVDKIIVDGKPIVDKSTGAQSIDPKTGELRTYADKYYVVIEFNGGTLKTEITKELYAPLEIGARYSCSGRIASVNVFGEAHLLPVFSSFTYLYGNEDF